MVNYFNTVCNFLITSIKKILHKDVIVVSDDMKNIQFIANDKKSQSFNIYRIMDSEDINIIGNKVCRDLAV